MKKIILTIAIAIVSVAIGIAAFANNGAKASDSPTSTTVTTTSQSKVMDAADKAARQELLKELARNAGTSVEEMKATIGYVQDSCDLGYDLYTKEPLNEDKKFTCKIVEDIDMSDYK